MSNIGDLLMTLNFASLIILLFTPCFKTKKAEKIEKILSKSPILVTYDQAIFEGDIFSFHFLSVADATRPTDRIFLMEGIFNWDEEALRWEIDILSTPDPRYTCLWYNPEKMSNFKVIKRSRG